MLRRYGEEPHARQIAREIVRRQGPIETTGELVEAIEAAIPAAVRRRFGGGHPAKRVFQAIRIVVNHELDDLDAALPEAWDLLRPGGRLAAISFHSLEDRRVKRFLAGLAQGCVCPPDFPVCVCGRTPEAELLNRRAVMPTPGELADNPRARSGRLRAATEAERLMARRTAAAAATRPAPAKRAPARRPPRRMSGPAPGGAVALPGRVMRAPFTRAARARAGGVLDALLQGRAWIALVGILLVGIVFFNVDLLELNRDIARTADKAAQMKRENAGLRLEVARLASSERIQRVGRQARPGVARAG